MGSGSAQKPSITPRYEQVTSISHPNSNGRVLVYFSNTPRHIGSTIIIKAENK
jgi:hypothetical protein